MSIRGPLSGVIFLLAQEQADEIAGVNQDQPSAFAALIRDGPDLARRTRELLETDQVDVWSEAVDPEDRQSDLRRQRGAESVPLTSPLRPRIMEARILAAAGWRRGVLVLISQKMTDAINAQIGREFGASQQYVAIAAHFGAENLPNLAHYFYRQAEEEREHAMKFVHHIVEAGGRVVIPAVAAPKDRFSSVEEAVKLSLDWEMEVTKQIYALVEQAAQDGNYATHHFLQWYVDEQLEEVSSMDILLSVVKRAGAQLLLVEDYLARTGHPEEPKAG